eukprot:Blabericola_migrator_1__11909@NODE_726_length_6713_cov_131_507824_g522_i0_p3_GENE_NODE_726_length_6713_cov_131_507824_g522_i0NODE_726_length_6713_cov_131_507824_g522_i0_p3_ORF_typecomplete_len241_score35_90Dus/PF01207_17/2_3e35His_biosynth/PF00977_21/9_2e09Oxidored_FMN/PF00724_20/1_4e07ThiG/PF05690_14/1_1e06DHO_dh/PF01180_21/2_6e06FMN_dh/PF01070_18/3_9e05NMO/PF03060_15/0_00027TMPTENI/PF02581_17/0_00098TMPTENI/PF02581_17/2_6e03NanE/PF04131_14/0_0013SOR_SNZ/PF01680_17/0_0048IMPDH/PF00478_25/0_026P
MVKELDVPIFVKLRLLDAEDVIKTMELCKRLEAAGASALCVHGRTVHQKGQFVGKAQWSMIAEIRAALSIPVIANGGVRNLSDAERCLESTGCAAVMCAEGLLENPSNFDPTGLKDIDQLMLELIGLYERYPAPSLAPLKAHLFHALYPGLQRHTDLRDRLAQSRTLEDYRQVVTSMVLRRKDESPSEKLGWYMRHRQQQPFEFSCADQDSKRRLVECGDGSDENLDLHAQAAKKQRTSP